MRAKRVPIKAYVFDFDDTLVKTDAKVHIYKDGRKIKSLTPSEYNEYELQPGESQNMDDFIDPRFIMNARKFKMWPALRNIDVARKMGRSDSDIYILTARSPRARQAIHNFLSQESIDIPIDNIICIGFDDGRHHNIAESKEDALKELRDRYLNVLFYDDSPENIELASRIRGIKTRLIDWNK